MSKQALTRKSLRTPRTPVYRQIEADLRTKVREGFWLPGAMLPSRKTLAEQYQVDLRTLQSAIVHLLDDGTLLADSRRGTFVPQSESAAMHLHLRDSLANIPGVQSRHLSRARRARTDATLGIVAVTWQEDSEYRDLSPSQSNWGNIVVSSLEQVFSEAGGATLFIKRHDHPRDIHYSIIESVDHLLADGAKAIAFVNVVMGSSDVDEIAACIEHERIPAVVLAWQEIVGTVPHVINDDVNGGYQASRHLLTAGYTPRIVIDPYRSLWSRQRIAGVREAVVHAGFPYESLQINPNSGVPDTFRLAAEDRDENAGYGLAQHAFMRDLPPDTGIIAVNDTAAYGVIRAARERGLRAGRDFGLVGFDDLHQSAVHGLTTLRPSFEDMGTETGRMLLRALDGQKIPHQVRLSPKLLARSSTHRVGG